MKDAPWIHLSGKNEVVEEITRLEVASPLVPSPARFTYFNLMNANKQWIRRPVNNDRSLSSQKSLTQRSCPLSRSLKYGES